MDLPGRRTDFTGRLGGDGDKSRWGRELGVRLGREVGVEGDSWNLGHLGTCVDTSCSGNILELMKVLMRTPSTGVYGDSRAISGSQEGLPAVGLGCIQLSCWQVVPWKFPNNPDCCQEERLLSTN